MGANSKNVTPRLTATSRQRPLFVTVIATLLVAIAVAAIVGGILLSVPSEGGTLSSLQTRLGVRSEEGGVSNLQILLAAGILAALGALLARGMWTLQNWARTAVTLLLGAIGLYYGLTVVFDAAAEIFGGEHVVPVSTILGIVLKALLKVGTTGMIPIAIIYALIKLGAHFEESPGQRAFVDRGIRYVLIATALSAVFIVSLIILFTGWRAWESIEKIGLKTMLISEGVYLSQKLGREVTPEEVLEKSVSTAEKGL